MIEISQENELLVVRLDKGDLAPKHESQLHYWGFEYQKDRSYFFSDFTNASHLIPKLVSCFTRDEISYKLSNNIQALFDKREEESKSLESAIEMGGKFKDGDQGSITEANSFLAFLKSNIKRTLKDHQIKAALHLLATRNGANFSVPGSGKTTVVLAVFQWLKHLGQVDSLFVVGPPACFGPWRNEYKEVIGTEPEYELLAGGDINSRRSKYLVNSDSTPDLFLTTFQTLLRDVEQVRILFQRQGVRFYLVVDEAHYIKQIGGSWASAVLNITQHAKYRCILSGTPFPRDFSDAFNLFDVLWPQSSPIPNDNRHKIDIFIQRKELDRAVELLNSSIGPLFYRVRKSDLDLAPQVFNEPISIRMNKYEKSIYDSILDKIRNLSQSDYFRDIDLLTNLRRGRMMRLRQCLSYAPLLGTAVTDYSENVVDGDISLSDIIMHYNNLESPAKLETLIDLVGDLLNKGEKVVVWSNFRQTLELLLKRISEIGCGVRLIYGDTPVQKVDIRDELTREEIISEFTNPTSGIDVLIANPAACAESISLHKTCSHAVYYDLSYNCAQYIQSLDRIHRVGGSENKPSYYYFLQYEDTIDNDILMNVRKKAENMSKVIDQDYTIYSLNMFVDDDEIHAYERLFGKNN